MRQWLIPFLLLFVPTSAYSTVPVIDYAAVAQLIEQVRQTQEMIGTLENQYQMLKRYAELDHEGLASSKFGVFISQFEDQFKKILEEIHGYQNMFDQISRLDEVYLPYHGDWGDEDDPILSKVRKQILWTKIQMKHAAKVGAQIRETFPHSQSQLEGLLDDTAQAQGVLLTAQIGNQIMGAMGSGLQTLNVQMNEFLQAYSSKSLEENESRGLTIRRLNDATQNLGEYESGQPAPKNPMRVTQ
jgi:conjugal transfer/entry exclusion protein